MSAGTWPGIDVGTTAVKGLAIDERRLRAGPSARPATRWPRRGPGWAEQDPEDWWRASESVLGAAARRRRGAPGRDRALGPDARPGRARRRRPRAAPGDPVERPAHRRRVRGDRADDRARAADRADRQPRAARLHGAQAAVAAPPRARGLATLRAASCCPRTTCGCGCAASTRPTSPTPPGRCCSTCRRGAGARRC